MTWCNVPLPRRKPFASRDAAVEKRLFFVSQQAFSDRYAEDAFSRFGNLISAYFMQGTASDSLVCVALWLNVQKKYSDDLKSSLSAVHFERALTLQMLLFR